ncbi:MAG TPA: CotS family spore coat protein [Desulfosporosinus sp.]|nr:CotS family spore coat protein [Desulfosporosinus sp.]
MEEEYMIQPWDNEAMQPGINLDMYVPPKLDELAMQVITYYDMEVHHKTLITSKPDKGGAIWKIETDKGPRSLKVLHRKPIRSLFSVGAQNYIVKQGGRVPALIKTKEGLLYVEKGGKVWIVTDWIETLTSASKDLEGARSLCYGLGEFHKFSRGYIPPAGSQRASRLYRWPAYYHKIIKKIGWFRNIAKAYNDLPSSHTLLSTIEIFERQALDALSTLEQSSYAQMISMGEEHWGLVHQDYGWSNGQLGIGGLWVIDLDGVAYDLPIRDLRKLISGTMDDIGRWDFAWIRSMIDAYHQANPLDIETYEILLNDLAFPNEFYKHINEMLYDPINYISENMEVIIQHLMLLEKTKGLALAELKLDQHKFPTGNYALRPVIEPETLEMMQLTAYMENSPSNLDMNQENFQLKKTQLLKEINHLVKDENFTGNKNLQKNENHQLKVLMICTEKLPVPPVRGGAIQTYIDGISRILSNQHDLTILGTTDPSLPLEEFNHNIRYVRIDGEQILEIYAEKVIDFLQNNSFDLIHVFNRPRLIPLIREVAPHARIILSMHNDMFGTHKIHHGDALTAINEVERIITVSDYVGNTISKLYPQAASKVQTIYSGVNLDTFIPWKRSTTAAQVRQKLREDYDLESKTVILFVGRLTPKKGTDLLIQALNELSSLDSTIALVIVGGTWYSVDKVTDYVGYVRALAEKTPFPVITTGYVSADLIHQWFWAGDIFVCPSQWQEPLARVHYEAMASGLPFLTTARGGNPEVVIEQNGFIVEQPEDSTEFAEKLKLLLTNPELRQKMGQTGRRLAEERFSWERVAHEVLEAWKPRFALKTIIESDISPSDLAKVLDKGDDLDKLKWLDKEDIIIDSALGVGSSVLKITRDMIVSMWVNNPSLNLTRPSLLNITRKTIVPMKVNTSIIDISCSYVVKITREMIVY